MSTLDSILAQLNDEAVTMKTASNNAPAYVNTEDAALEAVRSATKVAAAQQPQYSGDAVAALHKIAAETAAMEDVIMTKQAQDYGALVCDGFMQRLAQYDGAFADNEKTAGVASQQDLEKVAQAYYEQGALDFEKNAAAQYQAGYDSTMQQVHKIASDLHVAGQSNARQVVQSLYKTASVADAALRGVGGVALGGVAGALGGGINGALNGAVGGAVLGDEGAAADYARGMALRGAQGGALAGALGGGIGGLAGPGLASIGASLGSGLGGLAGQGLGLYETQQKRAASMPTREAMMAALKSPTAIGGLGGAALGAAGGAYGADEGDGAMGAALGGLGGAALGAGLGYGGGQLHNMYHNPVVDPNGRLARAIYAMPTGAEALSALKSPTSIGAMGGAALGAAGGAYGADEGERGQGAALGALGGGLAGAGAGRFAGTYRGGQIGALDPRLLGKL